MFMIKISPKFVPNGPIYEQTIIGLDDGLASNMRQAIIWTNADPIHWRIYTALGGDEFYLGNQQPQCWFQSSAF